jgi:hypothetical protein
MQIELGKLADGQLVIVSDPPFPSDVASVTFYVGQRLIVLAYPGGEDELMHYEVGDSASAELISTLDEILIVQKGEAGQLTGYDVPLTVIHD